MKKILIPEHLSGKALFEFLIANKSALIEQKKAKPKTTDPTSAAPEYFSVKEDGAAKTSVGEIPEDAASVRVKLVANTALWMDSQYDVLLPDCWKKSIKDGNGRLHLKNHSYTIDDEVGEVANIYSQEVSLTDLGLNKTGTTQSLIYESDVIRDYDPKTFRKYRKGRVNQHSIGLNYVKLELAVNDPEMEKEYAVWTKYYNLIINKDFAEKKGFFWAVSEIKLIEVSAVLAGANELTPSLEVSGGTEGEPSKSDTPPQPSKTEVPQGASTDRLANLNFFN